MDKMTSEQHIMNSHHCFECTRFLEATLWKSCHPDPLRCVRGIGLGDETNIVAPLAVRQTKTAKFWNLKHTLSVRSKIILSGIAAPLTKLFDKALALSYNSCVQGWSNHAVTLDPYQWYISFNKIISAKLKDYFEQHSLA